MPIDSSHESHPPKVFYLLQTRCVTFSSVPSLPGIVIFLPFPNNDCIALLALQSSIINSSRRIGHQIHPSPEFWSACSNFAMQPIPCHAMLPTAVEISAIYNYVINFDQACCSHHILHLDGIHSPAHGSDRLSSLPIESSVLPEPVGLAAASGR